MVFPQQPREGSFSNIGIVADEVTVPETGVYRSADGQISRRYRAGDRIPATEAALLGIGPAPVVGEPVPAEELTTAEAIAFLRGRGYQVSPTSGLSATDAAPGDEALIAQLQGRGYEVSRPAVGIGADALEAVNPPADPAELADKTPVAETVDSDADAKTAKGANAKAEPAPSNKAEPAPKNKSE